MYKGIILKLIMDDLVLSTSKYVFLFIIKVPTKESKKRDSLQKFHNVHLTFTL